MSWKSINKYLSDYTSKDYAGQEVSGKVLLDCSLGVNSDPLGDAVFEKLHGYRQEAVSYKGNYADIKYYPHDESIKSSLARWYLANGVGTGWLSADNFLLGNGSYDILTGINMMCLTRGRTVLGHAPQFTAYVDSVYCTGSEYRAVPLPAIQNYRFDEEAYLEMMTDDVDLFIIENPNNPTGQEVPLGSIIKIAEKALSMEKILVVDEAYAEYLSPSDSAVNLIEDYPNIIVTRSFSKGWGMAGLRLGYAAASTKTDTLEQLGKIILPFNSNALARALAVSSLESGPDNQAEIFGIQSVVDQKQRLADAIRKYNKKYVKSLRIARTHVATPILMIYYEGGDDDFNLYRHMLSKGLLTVSCESYIGLDGKAVRLMLPDEQNTELLLRIMEEVIRDLP